ncbi:hypothetical protein [Catellatospora sichuanensis]|uniref:hypothetical protein n=1 Tax=Catellatospora sichuanensis TaxID=1969805 RepID=UPI001FE31D92|nr:hypothetical protein [Catellatospora sichuanensis]
MSRLENRRNSGHGFNYRSDLVGGHSPAPICCPKRRLGDRLLCLGLGNPLLNQRWVCPRFECCPVASEFIVAGGDLVSCCLDLVLVRSVVLGVGHRLQGLAHVFRGERLSYPRVEQLDDLVFA